MQILFGQITLFLEVMQQYIFLREITYATANRVFTFVNSFSVIIGVSSLIWYGSFLFEGVTTQ